MQRTNMNNSHISFEYLQEINKINRPIRVISLFQMDLLILKKKILFGISEFPYVSYTSLLFGILDFPTKFKEIPLLLNHSPN